MRQLFSAVLTLMLHVTTSGQSNFKVNYDESKVPAYTLPEILRSKENVVIKSRLQWENIRRPEILKMFEDNIYGQMPKEYDSLRYVVTSKDDNAMNGKATLKEIVISVFRKKQSVIINLILFVPKTEKPAPLFLLINNRNKENTDPTRKIKSEFWPAEIAIDSGFAIAAFHVGDLAPDNKDSFVNGALRLYPEQLKADNGMRAIGAWAWGASRVMDYLEKEPGINAKQVAVVGHSRGGKAALWTSAQDQRFAICVSNNSGNSGAALARRKLGETVAVINNAFPHWFTPNYKKYNDNENTLPVDQHMLIALTAPRLLYATSASKDLWADPKGTFLALRNAERVYSLYNIYTALPANPPPINTPVGKSALRYHNREGVHDLTVYDWTRFLALAKQHFTSKLR